MVNERFLIIMVLGSLNHLMILAEEIRLEKRQSYIWMKKSSLVDNAKEQVGNMLFQVSSYNL